MVALNLNALLLALAALASTSEAGPLKKRIAQTIADSTAAWQTACEAAGGAQKCNPLAVSAESTLLAAAGPCDQQNAADQMVSLAKTLPNNNPSNQQMIALAQIFAQQPRNSPDSLQIPYCQQAPKNPELNGLFQCQFLGTKNTFVGNAQVGAPGTLPLGLKSLNPPKACPANPGGGIADGTQLVSITQNPGLGNIQKLGGSAGGGGAGAGAGNGGNNATAASSAPPTPASTSSSGSGAGAGGGNGNSTGSGAGNGGNNSTSGSGAGNGNGGNNSTTGSGAGAGNGGNNSTTGASTPTAGKNKVVNVAASTSPAPAAASSSGSGAGAGAGGDADDAKGKKAGKKAGKKLKAGKKASNKAVSSSSPAPAATASTGSGNGTGAGNGNGNSTGPGAGAGNGGNNATTGASTLAAGQNTAVNAAASTSPAPAAASSGSGSFHLQNGLDAQKLNKQFAALTPASSCTGTQDACVQGAFAQCVGGKFQTTSCAGGATCAALPLVNKPGTSVTCTTQQDALARIAATGATGGLTGSG